MVQCNVSISGLQYNDVAILTLESAVQFSPKVSPICLPSASDSNSYVNRDTVVMGWGTLREGGSQASKLMQVTVSVQPNDVCKKNYGSNAPGGIIDTMLCAAAPGKDSCQVHLRNFICRLLSQKFIHT